MLYYPVSSSIILFNFRLSYKKKEYISIQTLKKYYYSLIIPYLCYNFIFYPYWIVRYLIKTPNPYWYDFIKPIIGTFMLQHSSPYFESMNGVTWFIPSLTIMKLILSLTNHFRLGKYYLFLMVLCTSVFYCFNEYECYIIDLPFVGFIRCFPFFVLRYFCRQIKILPENTNKKRIYSLQLRAHQPACYYFIFTILPIFYLMPFSFGA